ncbi:unnamed protein product [Euphydryas editha]|nr:unnamed protein product [Euphydryas editha]
MIWGGMFYEARNDLVIFYRGSVNVQRYVEEVLQDHVITFAPFIGENFRFMHDNARCHVARSVTEYLDEAGIQTLPLHFIFLCA